MADKKTGKSQVQKKSTPKKNQTSRTQDKRAKATKKTAEGGTSKNTSKSRETTTQTEARPAAATEAARAPVLAPTHSSETTVTNRTETLCGQDATNPCATRELGLTGAHGTRALITVPGNDELPAIARDKAGVSLICFAAIWAVGNFMTRKRLTRGWVRHALWISLAAIAAVFTYIIAEEPQLLGFRFK